jgi:hypothetical protein
MDRGVGWMRSRPRGACALDGTFRLSGLKPGRYGIRAESDRTRTSDGRCWIVGQNAVYVDARAASVTDVVLRTPRPSQSDD